MRDLSEQCGNVCLLHIGINNHGGLSGTRQTNEQSPSSAFLYANGTLRKLETLDQELTAASTNSPTTSLITTAASGM